MCKTPTILWIANATAPARSAAQVKSIAGSLPTAPTLGLAPPSHVIRPLRDWQKPLQDPTPVEGARTVTRMAGVLNHA